MPLALCLELQPELSLQSLDALPSLRPGAGISGFRFRVWRVVFPVVSSTTCFGVWRLVEVKIGGFGGRLAEWSRLRPGLRAQSL